MSKVSLQPGRAYSLEYPRHNYRQLPPATESRKIVVTSIRDMLDEPLDQVTETLNPLLKRGRWLVTGMDLDKDVERSFYVESMNQVRALSLDELRPLKGVEYIVVEQFHVACKTKRLKDALKFQGQRQSGAICAVLCVAPRDSILEAAS